MIKRRAALAVVLMALLAGCTPSRPAAEEKEEKTVITVLCGQSTSDYGLEEILEETLAQYHIDLRWESVDWGAGFSSAFRARYISGEMPDLIIGKAQDVEKLQSFGCIAPFSEYFAALFQEEALESVTVDGVVYGLPLNRQYQGVLYNKNMFWRYGLSVPKTQQELEALVEKLEAIDVTPFASHFQEVWYTGNVLMQLAVNEVFSQDAQWGDHFRAGETSFAASNAMQNCIEQLQYIRAHSWSDAMLLAQLDADARFAQEEAAMYPTGTWSVQALQSIRPGMEIGIFPYPNTTGDSKLLVETNLTFMKSAQSEHQQLLDAILYHIFSDYLLAEDFYDFSQSYTTLLSTSDWEPEMLVGEVQPYWESGDVQDVQLGNGQLSWDFQYMVAEQILLWMQGTLDFDQLLAYADENRSYSQAMLY